MFILSCQTHCIKLKYCFFCNLMLVNIKQEINNSISKKYIPTHLDTSGLLAQDISIKLEKKNRNIFTLCLPDQAPKFCLVLSIFQYFEYKI